MEQPTFNGPFYVNCGSIPPLAYSTVNLATREGFIHTGYIPVNDGFYLDEPDYALSSSTEDLVKTDMDESGLNYGVPIASHRNTNNTNQVLYRHPTGYVLVERKKSKDRLVVNFITHFHKTITERDAFANDVESKLSPVVADTDSIPVTFWYNTQDGPDSYSSKLKVPSWDEIKQNYPSQLASKLEALIDHKLAVDTGSLMLLHGIAGSGKTYFIRSLLRAWKEQCSINYIIDVDSLFGAGGASYLVRMLSPDPLGRFKFFILEDTGEMVSKEAKNLVGQGLSRMLNVSDGILGQGCKIVMLMSTNEQVGSLHEAISRPGRCFANLEFTSFNTQDANAWLKNHGQTDTVNDYMTLASLYDRINKDLIVNKEVKKIGF